MPDPIVSPDGRYALRFTCDMVGSAEWVYCPVLVDLFAQQVVFTLGGTLWSVEVACWADDSQILIMGLRRMLSKAPAVCARVEPARKTACLDDSAYSIPLSQVYERLEARYQSWLQHRAVSRVK